MSERSTTPNDRKGRAVFSAVSEERCLKPSRHSESSQPIRNGWSNANRRLKELGLNDSQLDQLKAFSADEIEHVVDLAAHMTFEQTRQAVSDARGMTPELRKTFFLRKQTNPNLTTTNFLVEQYLVQQEQARFQQVRADDAQQNADELKAIFCQSTTTLLTNDQKYKEAYQKWKEEYRGHVPTVENVYEQFKFELVVGEVSRTTQANDKRSALCNSAMKLFQELFQEGVSPSNTQEAVTQRFWTSLLRAVQTVLGNTTDMLEVHDTSSSSFVGSSEQPDISLAPRNMGCESFTFVQKIVELKTGGRKAAGLSQIYSRARDLRLLKGRRSYEIEGAVADDKTIDLLRCVLSRAGPKLYLVASANLLGDWTSLFHVIRALLSNKFICGEQEHLQPRESGKLGSSNVVATLQLMENKPTVTLERDDPVSGNSTYVVKKKYPFGAEAYQKEKTNLETVFKAMQKDGVSYPSAHFNDATSTIIFNFIGHRVRIHTSDQVKDAFNQLSKQLHAAHGVGMWHGDISPRNIVMCLEGNVWLERSRTVRETVERQKAMTIADWIKASCAALERCPRTVEYYLIDWSEAETISSDQNQGCAVTLQCSYPLPVFRPQHTPTEELSIDVYKRRDEYALRCSLIMLYTESVKLGEDWMWRVQFGFGEQRSSFISKCIKRRADVLIKIADENDVNPFPEYIRGLARNCNAIWERDSETIFAVTMW